MISEQEHWKPEFAQRNIGVLGTGSFVPERILTNRELAGKLGICEDWIVLKTGILERRVAAPHEATSDLATRAAEKALEAAGISAEDVDLIVVATSTPDYPQPATACLVQANLGSNRAAAFDLNAVCAGFVCALDVAASMLHANPLFEKALVIGADTYSNILDYQDRRTCVLFGDGAGAVVLGRVSEGYGLLANYHRVEGGKSKLVMVPAGGSREPTSADTVEDRKHYFKMRGREVRDFIPNAVTDVFHHVLFSAGFSWDDLDLVVMHQANAVLLENLREQFGLPREKMPLTVERYGNTGAASVPLTLDEAVRGGWADLGAHVVLVAVGGGMTWGGTALRWARSSVGKTSQATKPFSTLVPQVVGEV